MKRTSVSVAIRRAVLIALAPACGQSQTQPNDAGNDVVAPLDAAVDVTSVDGADDGGADVDDSSVEIPDVPPPPGCIITGKPDGFAPCGYTEQLNDPNICTIDQDADADIQDPNLCYHLCSWDEPDCTYYALGDETYFLTCGAGCIGRLHDDARAEEASCCAPLRTTAADYLADAARLEAEAIAAFEIVAEELARFGAPSVLVAAARRAADDERRHAKIVGKLSGREIPAPTNANATRRLRNLRALALENAVEGCVRETYGAALAHFQAARARDEAVRDAMRAIADDETAHAELGWQIDAWLARTLDARTLCAVNDARRAAIDALESSIETCVPRAFDAELGLPTREEARALFDALFKSAA